MSRHNRLKLRPLSNQQFKISTPQGKEQRSFTQFISNNLPRFKTQGNQQNNSIFPIYLSVGRRHTTQQKDPRKQYELFRQLQLRNDYSLSKHHRHKKDIRLIRPSKQSAIIINKMNKKADNLIISKDIVNAKIKDLSNNILHICKIFTSILKRGDPRQIISSIKFYVLQQQSDLGQIQQGISDDKMQLAIKQLIYYQRVYLMLVVEYLLNRKFNQNESFFHQLIKDFINFYSLIYQIIVNQSLNNFLSQNNLKYISQYTTTLSPFSLFSIKDRVSKRISNLCKLFNDIDKFINGQLLKIKTLPTNLLYYNLLQFYATKLASDNWDGWGIQFLSTCPSPYLHHQTDFKYTLLLDLDQTLVHYRVVNSSKGEFLLRPYLFQFLQKIQPHFQVGIFTCALKDYADIILEHLPTISIRLYRQHAVKIGRQLIKDLSRVGRDLSKVILVDNLQKNFQLQKQNGIHVRSWFGDPNDNVLKDLLFELQKIAKAEPQDLRKSLHKRSFL